MACCALFAAAVHAQVTIDIDTQQRGPKVSPMLYGIFYEDINHAADGGIYARCPPLLAEHRQNQVSLSPGSEGGRRKSSPHGEGAVRAVSFVIYGDMRRHGAEKYVRKNLVVRQFFSYFAHENRNTEGHHGNNHITSTR